jgi:transcriptional regulator with XRE-family HTH domain
MSEFTSLTAGQMRAARALLRWSAADLAEKSDLGIATVQRAEASDGVPSMTRANMAAIRRALEAAGVEFIAENGGGAGVRLRTPLTK